ncbi:MAG: ATP-binding protein [Planctomycetota bacterium]|nr:ATP-binding protein [Planctomycetota bacterium]
MTQEPPLNIVIHGGIPMMAFGLTAMLPTGSGGWLLSMVLFGWATCALLTLIFPEMKLRQETVDLIASLSLVAITGGVASPFAPLLPVVIVITGARRGTREGLMRATAASLVLASATILIAQAPDAETISQGAAPWMAMALALHGVALLSGQLTHRWRALEEEHDRIVQALEEGIIVTDLKGHVIRTNPAARTLLEFPDGDDWRGEPLSNLLRRSTDKELCIAFSQTGHAGHCIDWSPRIGLKKSFQVRTTVIDGGLRVAVFTDRSSELRALEAEARLQHLEALEELALGLAHEIRNPLASLRGAAVELVSGTLPPDQAQRMEAIVRRESDRLDRTVDGFLEYSRSRRVEQPTEVDLVDVIDEVIDSISQRQDARDLKVTRQLDEPSLVLGDADSLHQVIRNLVINAIEAEASHLKISSSVREDFVLLEISDDGTGMTAELQKRAFLPFVSTKTREGGLGLALVRKIVESVGGWIDVESQPNTGTTFQAALPTANQTSEKVAI